MKRAWLAEWRRRGGLPGAAGSIGNAGSAGATGGVANDSYAPTVASQRGGHPNGPTLRIHSGSPSARTSNE